jgi:SAM-dependent methyltransferase
MYTESDLSFSRQKPRFFWIRTGYQLARLTSKLLGRERTLRICANGAWLCGRLGFEAAGDIYGEPFHTATQALSPEFLKRHVTEDSTIVDVGCGTGRWCRTLSYADKVVGVDFDESAIETARQLGGEIEYVVGDVTRDLVGRKFDFALLSRVLEHIDCVDEFLRSLHEVAGKLIVEVPDVENDPLNWARIKQNAPFYSDGDHVREYTRQLLFDHLQRNGWEIVDWRQEKRTILAVASANIGSDK